MIHGAIAAIVVGLLMMGRPGQRSPSSASPRCKPSHRISPVGDGARPAGLDCNHHLTEGFRVMLETAIVKSNKMDVMERKQVGVVIQEQGLGQMGLTTSGGKVGGLTGIDYLIYGSITKFGARKSGFAVSGSLLSSATKGLLGGAAAPERHLFTR